MGHIARACRKGKVASQTQYVEARENVSERDDDDELFGLYTVCSTSSREKGYTVDVTLGDQSTAMLLDTGSAVSVVSDKYYKANLAHFPLKPAPRLKRKAYSGKRIPVRGYIMIPVQYENQQVTGDHH